MTSFLNEFRFTTQTRVVQSPLFVQWFWIFSKFILVLSKLFQIVPSAGTSVRKAERRPRKIHSRGKFSVCPTLHLFVATLGFSMLRLANVVHGCWQTSRWIFSEMNVLLSFVRYVIGRVGIIDYLASLIQLFSSIRYHGSRHQSSAMCIIMLGGRRHTPQPWSATKVGNPIPATIPVTKRNNQQTTHTSHYHSRPVEIFKAAMI